MAANKLSFWETFREEHFGQIGLKVSSAGTLAGSPGRTIDSGAASLVFTADGPGCMISTTRS